MKRIVSMIMPDGSACYALPYHVCLKGHPTAVLCRDTEDYDAVVKIICVCARRKNVCVVIYAVLSNHCHVVILAASAEEAKAFAQELKRMLSMWLAKKYDVRGIMKDIAATAIPMESSRHIRNALAYVPRNALDNGCNITTYEWSGFRAMFKGDNRKHGRPVGDLTRREKEAVMHTADDLKGTHWELDENDRLIPESFCVSWYLEQAFENDQAFFLRTIGSVVPSEMNSILVDNPREMTPDTEFLKAVNDKSVEWYGCEVSVLPEEKRLRLASYLNRIRKTTVSQLARVLELPQEKVTSAIGK